MTFKKFLTWVVGIIGAFILVKAAEIGLDLLSAKSDIENVGGLVIIVTVIFIAIKVLADAVKRFTGVTGLEDQKK